MAKFYQVGGSIRDEILGIKSKDVDFSVEAESFDAMREAILSRGGKIFVETPKFFTIRAHIDGLGDADFVLCRREGEYKDGRRPESVEIGTIFDDLRRRDFSMNAIAKDCDTGEIIDPHNGISAIKNELITCVGNVEDRFNEDGLRILRALRFSVTKGFNLSWKICEFITCNDMEEKLRGVSQERIRDELFKMFKCDSVKTLHLLMRQLPKFDFLFSNNLWLKPTTES